MVALFIIPDRIPYARLFGNVTLAPELYEVEDAAILLGD